MMPGTYSALYYSLLTLLTWTGMAPLAWLFLRKLPAWKELGALVASALGLAVGLMANFLAFFLALPLGISSPSVLLSASLLLTLSIWLIFSKIAGRSSGKTWPAQQKDPALLSLISGAALVLMAWRFFSDMSDQAPGIIDSWDAAISWNRWAMEWINEGRPIYTMGYPQLLPTAMAQVYLWFGSTEVQPAVRLLLLIFPLVPLLLFIDGFIRWRSMAFIWSGIFWLACLTWLFPELTNSGYADVPGACFAAVTGYLLLLGSTGAISMSSSLYLSAFTAAAAVLTKQPAGIGWLMWLAVASRFWLYQPMLRGTTYRAAAVFLILAAPWYLYTFYNIHTGQDVTNLSYLTQGVHGSRVGVDRFIHAMEGPLWDTLKRTGNPGSSATIASLLVLISCLHIWGRWIVLGVVLPYFILWGFLFSYDARNLLPILGIFCLALGLGVSETFRHVIILFRNGVKEQQLPAARHTKTPSCFPPWILMMSFWLFIGHGIHPHLDVASLEKMQRLLQARSGSPGLNEELLAYRESPGFDGEVMTSYLPMILIPELRQHILPLTLNPKLGEGAMLALMQGKNLCEVMDENSHWMKNVRYLLIHEVLSPQVINRALANGEIKIELEMDGIRLISMNCKAS